MFERKEYTVKLISGDYAILLTDDNIENTVALALLPIDISEGDRLVWENLEYSKL
ncbi:MAG: chorismate--pyruvate lyase [Oscillospiraceae bacterium]|nr:chorismate--pyruvate lyase [Oscillospiraceae bacterium]